MQTTPASTKQILFDGFLTWLIPFLVSIPFVGRDGQTRIPLPLFKSLMIVVGAAVGAWLLVRLFRRRPPFSQPGLWVGTAWLIINVALDLAVLVPLTGMAIPAYVNEIAVRYLIIPIMAVAIDNASRPPALSPPPA